MASTSKLNLQKPKQQSEVEQPTRNWSELPTDVMSNILFRISAIDILENAQKLCTAWHKICKDDPALWRVVHMDFSDPTIRNKHAAVQICKNAVDRSQGQLVDITIVSFGDFELLLHIANRSSQLKRLKVECGFYDLYGGWTGALKKFPLLEELNLYATKISAAAVEIAGRNCPMLRILKLNQDDDTFYARESDAGCLKISDEIAIAIGKNFHGLRHLELIRSRMLNIGLLEILNGCIQLETLDLRRCMNIDLNGNLGKRCFEQIKCLKLPNDSLETREVFVYVPVNGKYILQKTTREI